jgi:hypothetical protein|tara:strand:- start:1167 stop:1706 length:540 start_codon:yes stop_codon:yes gene_type:complete
MSEIRNHILAVIGIFGVLSIPLFIDSCTDEKEEIVALNTLTEESSYDFEVDSIRLEHRADTYLSENTNIDNALEEATSFMSESAQETVLEQEVTDEVDNTTPLNVVADSFNEAFHVARVHLGPGKNWVWDANGITYTTFYAEEKAKYDSLNATYWTEEELSSGIGSDIVEEVNSYTTED